jgi:hypothetical protein
MELKWDINGGTVKHEAPYPNHVIRGLLANVYNKTAYLELGNSKAAADRDPNI